MKVVKTEDGLYGVIMTQEEVDHIIIYTGNTRAGDVVAEEIYYTLDEHASDNVSNEYVIEMSPARKGAIYIEKKDD